MKQLKAYLWSTDGLDSVDAIETCEQCVRVVHAMLVVLGYEVDEQVHLFFAHCLDHEALVVRDEEDAARFARGGQLSQSAAGKLLAQYNSAV